MGTNEIHSWLEQARKGGLSNEQISDQLKKSGWNEVQIQEALKSQPLQPSNSIPSIDGEYSPRNYTIGKQSIRRALSLVRHLFVPYLLFMGIGVAFVVAFNYFGKMFEMSLLVYAIEFLIVMLVMSFVYYAGSVIVATEEKALGKIFSTTLRRFFPFYITMIISVLIIYGGMFLLIIPGILMAIAFSMLPFVMANEDVSWFAALRRCYILVRKFRGNMFAQYVLLYLLNLVFFVGIVILFVALSFVFKNISSSGFSGIVILALMIFLYTFVPFFQSAFASILYKDLLAIRPPGSDAKYGKKGTILFIIYIIVAIAGVAWIFSSTVLTLNKAKTNLQTSTQRLAAYFAYVNIMQYYDQNKTYPTSLTDMTGYENSTLTYELNGYNDFKVCANLQKPVIVNAQLTNTTGISLTTQMTLTDYCYTSAGLINDQGQSILIMPN